MIRDVSAAGEGKFIQSQSFNGLGLLHWLDPKRVDCNFSTFWLCWLDPGWLLLGRNWWFWEHWMNQKSSQEKSCTDLMCQLQLYGWWDHRCGHCFVHLHATIFRSSTDSFRPPVSLRVRRNTEMPNVFWCIELHKSDAKLTAESAIKLRFTWDVFAFHFKRKWFSGKDAILSMRWTMFKHVMWWGEKRKTNSLKFETIFHHNGRFKHFCRSPNRFFSLLKAKLPWYLMFVYFTVCLCAWVTLTNVLKELNFVKERFQTFNFLKAMFANRN